MRRRKDDNRKKHTIVNRQYVATLFEEYLRDSDEAKVQFLAERIINEYEIEIFAKIREICCEEAVRRIK
jgi:hypothetical protein